MGGNIPKRVKKWPKKENEVSYKHEKVFLSGKKDLKPYKRMEERKRNPKYTRLSSVESPVFL